MRRRKSGHHATRCSRGDIGLGTARGQRSTEQPEQSPRTRIHQEYPQLFADRVVVTYEAAGAEAYGAYETRRSEAMASFREALGSGNRSFPGFGHRSRTASTSKRVHFGPRHDTSLESHSCPICGAQSGQPCISNKGVGSGMRLSATHAGRVAAHL